MKYKKPITGLFWVIAFWQIIAWLGFFNPIYFASPYEVIIEMFKMFSTSSVYLDIFSTLNRIIISVVISAIIGIPIGIGLGYFSNIYQYLKEMIDFLRSIPPIVIYPLLLIVLGPGDGSRIGVAIFGSIVVLILIVSKGILQQSTLRKRYFASIGANRVHVISHVVLYESLPYILLALRTATSLSIIIIIVTEMLVGSRFGLGTRVQNVQITGNIPDLFATIIIIGIIGVLTNAVLVRAERKYVFWKI